MAFTARTTATFGEVWTVVASSVRVTQVQWEVIMFTAVVSTNTRRMGILFIPPYGG